MNKNFKIFHISGLSGLMLLLFVSAGLLFGFIVFPVIVAMMCWNTVVGEMMNGPVINYYQAALLWLAVLLSLYLLLKNSISIKIQKESVIDPREIKDIINEIKEKDSEIKEIKEKEEINSKK